MDQMEVKSEELLALIRPTISSKTARKNILNALTEILEKEYNSKVFVYGSFPLNTYLPCGDIDVSMAARPALPRSIIVSVGAFLASYNDKNPGAPISIEVNNVIEPESAGGVSLVKCVVENMPVDISINTLGGVCSLAFLEEADLKIGMSHLLKKSVILIKAWLKYENEPTILKSSEGLLSTYALQVMILYIINRFSTEVKTPLKCLQKFLEYFSNFDWKKHILTISGPILKGSNMPGKCYKQYSFLASSGWFNEKEISIVDPVDPCNNIGKSVKKILEFIRGLVDGYSKFNSIVVSSDMLMPFPTLTAKFSGSNSSQLSDLKGDLNQMIKCVEEARELHSLIKRAHQKPHHLSHDSTPSSDQLRPQPPQNINTPNYPPPLPFDHNHWSQEPPLFTHPHPYHTPNPNFPWLTPYQVPPPLITHHHPHHTPNPNLHWLTPYQLPPSALLGSSSPTTTSCY